MAVAKKVKAALRAKAVVAKVPATKVPVATSPKKSLVPAKAGAASKAKVPAAGQVAVSPAVHVLAGKAKPGGKPMAPSSYTARVRKSLGVPQDVFARMLRCSLRTVANWEADKGLGKTDRSRVVEMERLGKALAEVMRPDYIPTWLTNPVEDLGGLTPVEILERGHSDRLWRLVLLMGSGMPV